jgi:hypothetical protein
MLKRTLIAIAVVAFLASGVFAAGPEVYEDNNGDERGFKIDPQKMDVFWPYEYKAVDLCKIPVYLELGILVHVDECHKKKIVLKQVDCADKLDKGAGDFPCYQGCTDDISIRTNFPIQLGLKRDTLSNVLKSSDWRAYWAGDFDGKLGFATGWQKVKVCADAWKVRLFNEEATGAAGQRVHVGDVTITVKPQV